MCAYIVIFKCSLFGGSLLKKFNTMSKETFIKSRINVVKARIEQIKESDLFSQEQKDVLVEHNESELSFYEQELAKNMEVVNPEIL